MHEVLTHIPKRIVGLAEGSLALANMHAAFFDPQAEYWERLCILSAAHAGELFIKAIIALEHPLLIFKDVFSVDDNISANLSIEKLIERGRTYDFKDLPRLLWVATGKRLPDMQSFEKIQRTRNAIQHFCAPELTDLRSLALEFIYNNIDPLIYDNFGLCAIEYHEDHSIGYDYLVSRIVRQELLFSIPDGFSISEFDLSEELEGTSPEYRAGVLKRLSEKGIELQR